MNNAVKIVLGIIVVGIATLILLRLEKVTEQVDYGWSPKAILNPYLAAHQLLETRIQSIDSVNRLGTDKLNEKISVLFIPNANFIKLPSQQQRILTWVENGGHLVIGVGGEAEPPMLSDLGFSQEWSTKENREEYWDDYDYEDDETSEELSDEEKEEDEKSFADLMREQNEKILEQQTLSSKEEESTKDAGGPRCVSEFYRCNAHVEPTREDAYIVNLTFENVDKPLEIDFSWGQIIDHEGFYENAEYAEVAPNPLGIDPFYWDGDDSGIYFAQTYYGNGMVSVISTFNIWKNQFIGHFDHAYLLTLLVGHNDTALLLYGKYMPSLDVLAYRHFFEALIGFAVLTIICLWYYSRRFGPVYSSASDTRRSRSEQFSAMAQFHWKFAESDTLIQHIRDDIQKRASRHWHDFADWPQKKQDTKLAEHSELAITTITNVMHKTLRFHESEFTQTIRTLQILRNSL